ncbi:MAG: methyltransferase [Candidatus Parvarchaeota archaeon]|nr:methyltransferase [Candidatus Jingweiarchaeum tengchongense]
MNSRERIISAINHREPDRTPLDLGGFDFTGIHVSSLHILEVALGLKKPNEPVKVVDLVQMLGEIDEKLRETLEIDTIPLRGQKNYFGFKNENWKPWTFFDGTPLLVPEKFNTIPDKEGNIYQYPQGDTSALPCVKMPKDGFYFDDVDRSKPIDEESLNVEDQLEECKLLTDEELSYYEKESKRLFEETNYAITFPSGVSGTNLGDSFWIPGWSLKNPRGIRNQEEWYISLITRKDFIRDVNAKMTEIGIENLKLLHQAVGERIQVIMISSTDFGAQNGLLYPKESYQELFKPFHKRINDWVHRNTTWKTLIHSCGSDYDIIPDFIEAGFDILNPVQISAAKMEPERLKKEFGDHIVFWGGGINTQTTLPFGTPQEVEEEVKKNISIFGEGGGFVYATVHDIQARIPLENLLALFRAVNDVRGIKVQGL